VDLSAFYPYPARVDGGLPAAYWFCPFIVAAIVALFAWSLRRARVLAFGIAFFTLNLVFVLQLVPVGGAIIADRYSYVASIGLFVPLAAAAPWALERRREWGIGVLVALGLYIAMLGVATHRRTAVWQDSLTLWNDVIARHDDIAIAHLNRALARYERGDLAGAERDLSETIRISPEYGRGWAHRGVIRHQLGRTEAGLRDMTRALTFEPSAENHTNRGSLRLASGNAAGAIADFDRALALQPGHVMAYNNRGHARAAAGDPQRALADFQIASQLAPRLITAQVGAGNALLALGDPAGAERDFQTALELDPSYGPARLGRGLARAALGKRGEACEDLRVAAHGNVDGAARSLAEHCER
jgi:tetratricopeptide (TPR) repeat protein